MPPLCIFKTSFAPGGSHGAAAGAGGGAGAVIGAGAGAGVALSCARAVAEDERTATVTPRVVEATVRKMDDLAFIKTPDENA
jgi:hypothetical protein